MFLFRTFLELINMYVYVDIDQTQKREIEVQIDRWTNIQKNRQTNKQAGGWMIQTERNRERETQMGRKIYRDKKDKQICKLGETERRTVRNVGMWQPGG